MSSETRVLGIEVTLEDQPEEIERFVENVMDSTEWANLFFVWAATMLASTALGMFGGLFTMLYIGGPVGGVLGTIVVVVMLYLGVKTLRVHKNETLKLILKAKSGEYGGDDDV